MNETRTIVLAKAVPEIRAMLNRKYRLLASVWLNEGTAKDFRAAEKYAKTEGYTVITFDTNEPYPLERAKLAVMPEDMEEHELPTDLLAFAYGYAPCQTN